MVTKKKRGGGGGGEEDGLPLPTRPAFPGMSLIFLRALLAQDVLAVVIVAISVLGCGLLWGWLPRVEFPPSALRAQVHQDGFFLALQCHDDQFPKKENT
jgi:hypothetical protein